MQDIIQPFLQRLGELSDRLVGVMPEIPSILLACLGALLLIVAISHKPRKRGDLTESTPGSFETKPLHDTGERRLHRELEALIPRYLPGTRLLSQVSMVEFLYARRRVDYLSIGHKRVDFLVVDRAFRPVLAIECIGGSKGRVRPASRHWEIRRALRLAGVPLMELTGDIRRPALEQQLAGILEARPWDVALPAQRTTAMASSERADLPAEA